MSQAIVAVFDDYRDAQNAREDLISAGISSRAIDMSSAYEAAQSDRATIDRSERYEGDDSLTGRIRHFFTSLFDDDDDDAKHYGHRYMEAVRRGSCVLTVRADDDDSIDDIEQIMERHNAIDIDERSANWQQRGWDGFDAHAPRLSEAELLQEREYYRSPLSSPASIGSASSLGGTVTADSLAGNDPERSRDEPLAGAVANLDQERDLPVARPHMDRDAGLPQAHYTGAASRSAQGMDDGETPRRRVRVFSRLREQPLADDTLGADQEDNAFDDPLLSNPNLSPRDRPSNRGRL